MNFDRGLVIVLLICVFGLSIVNIFVVLKSNQDRVPTEVIEAIRSIQIKPSPISLDLSTASYKLFESDPQFRSMIESLVHSRANAKSTSTSTSANEAFDLDRIDSIESALLEMRDRMDNVRTAKDIEQQHGSNQPNSIQPEIGETVLASVQGNLDSYPHGTVLPIYGQPSFIPRGWMFCNGFNGTPDLNKHLDYTLSYGAFPTYGFHKIDQINAVNEVSMADSRVSYLCKINPLSKTVVSTFQSTEQGRRLKLRIDTLFEKYRTLLESENKMDALLARQLYEKANLEFRLAQDKFENELINKSQ